MAGTTHPLSDAASAFLAEHYRTHAEVCRQMALAAADLKEGWLQFAREWTKLAQETEANARQSIDDRPKLVGAIGFSWNSPR
jgi:hypothetical protein